MKYNALIYHGAKDFSFQEMEMPECGENDVILKNVVASVCGSDTDTWLNGGELHYFPKDVEFGHEVSCVVHQVGKNVKDIQVGDRVAPFPLLTTPNRRKAGFLGGFSEYIYCTNASYDYNLFRLPDNVSDMEASLIEPMSVGIRGADIVPVTPNTVALVLGAGFVGFSLAAALAYKGVPRQNITLVDRCENRLEFCRKEGFHAVSTDQENWQQAVFECTGGAYCVYGPGSNADVIYDCAGSINPNGTAPTLMELGMKMLKYGGKMVAVGVHRRQVNINMQKLVFGMQDILCGSGNTKEYFEKAIEILASKQFDFEGAITRSYKHSDAIEGIVSTCAADSCIKVVIDYRL